MTWKRGASWASPAAVVAAGLLSAGNAAIAAAERALPQPVRGVVLSLHDADPGRSYAGDVREIRELGANSISIMPTWRMATIRSPRALPGKSTWQQLDEALRAADEHGLDVLLAPTLQIDDLDEGEWRGVLAPPDWEVWFASYRDLLLRTARLAERHGVVALLVGSELCSTERFEDRWQELIADVRAVFRGQLGYQANWDHRDVPQFLDELDLLASNAYFELVPYGPRRPTTAQLTRAWRPFKADLIGWSRRHDKPLLLTEIGYPSLRGAAAYPWDYTRESPTDGEEQRRAYEAFFRVWSDEPGAVGFFVYEWWGRGGAQDRGYTPRGKPAEAVVRRWFARDLEGAASDADEEEP